MTSVNGIPGDGPAGGGTGPAPGRAARRQPAAPIPQARRSSRRKPARQPQAGRDQGTAPAPGTPPADTGTPGPTPAVTLIPAPAKAPEPASPATAAPAPSKAPAPAPPAAGSPAVTLIPASREPAPSPPATPPTPVIARADLFVRQVRAYVANSAYRQIAILQAGATTAADLGVDALRAGGANIVVSLIDADEPVTRAAVASHPNLADCTLGDLRTVPLAPRAFDIISCASLLERIEHAELVLDRLIGAIKPGGVLLLRIHDRDSAAGFLDRHLPGALRQAIWRTRHPGEPGPHPAVYEQLSSARGVQAYALLRGLVIGERQALGGLAGGLPPGPPGFLAAQKLVARLSGGRLTAAHEEMLYVLRKPESQFARIL